MQEGRKVQYSVLEYPIKCAEAIETTTKMIDFAYDSVCCLPVKMRLGHQLRTLGNVER